MLEEDVRKFIKTDATAVIGTEGLMGNKLVNILPGAASQKVVQNNAMLRTMEPHDVDEIINNLKVVSGNAAVITADLAKITSSITRGKSTAGKLFMDSAFAMTIEQSIQNVERGTAGFSENMEALKDNILLRGYYRKKEKEEQKRKEDTTEKRKGWFRKK